LAKFLAVVAGIYTVALIVLTMWWRPGRRRFGALVCGTFAAAMLGPLLESVAHWAGFWRYALASDTPAGPLLFYPLGMINFFVLGLIAWRIGQRWGIRGQGAYVAFISVTGPIRDYFEADRWFNIVRFGSGIFPFVWDLFAWFSLLSIIILVNEKMAGPSYVEPATATERSRPVQGGTRRLNGP